MRYVHGPGDGAATFNVVTGAYAKWMKSRGLPIGGTDAFDDFECACPILLAFCAARNDLTPVKELQRWAPAAGDWLIGSRRDRPTTVRRLRVAAHYAVAEIVAPAVERAMKAALDSAWREARALRLLTPDDIEDGVQPLWRLSALLDREPHETSSGVVTVRNGLTYALRFEDPARNDHAEALRVACDHFRGVAVRLPELDEMIRRVRAVE